MERSRFADLLTDPSGLSEEQASITHALHDQIFVFDPVDEGNTTWLKRDAAIELIQTLESITNPSEIFKTVLTVNDELALIKLVGEMQQRMLSQMRAQDYDDAAKTLSQLMSIEVIDNMAVTRLVQNVKDSVRTHAQHIERKATQAAMMDDFALANTFLKELEIAQTALATTLPVDDITSIIASVRAYCERRERAIKSQAETQAILDRMQREHTDLKEQYTRTEGLLRGQIEANTQLQGMNDAKMKEMRENAEAAEKVGLLSFRLYGRVLL